MPTSIRILYWRVSLALLLGSVAGVVSLPVAAADEVRTLAGWKVNIHRDLLAHEPKLTEKACELLTTQLETIVRDVPAAPVAKMREVPLYMSPTPPGAAPKAEYHPDANWLRENNRDPTMARAVEFTNIPIFEAECRRMPMLALHELAHAYHHRELGHDHEGILAAYKRAKDSGSYEAVERSSGKIERAYAMANDKEYFAECSEAFFGRNDFFPFDLPQLRRHDPSMTSLLEEVWQVK